MVLSKPKPFSRTANHLKAIDGIQRSLCLGRVPGNKLLRGSGAKSSYYKQCLVSQSVKSSRFLQQSVIIRWKWHIWDREQGQRDWTCESQAKVAKAPLFTVMPWLSPLNLPPGFLGNLVKPPSHSSVQIDWLRMWNKCEVEYACLRTKVYIYIYIWFLAAPRKPICICVTCLWNSRLYGTKKICFLEWEDLPRIHSEKSQTLWQLTPVCFDLLISNKHGNEVISFKQV